MGTGAGAGAGTGTMTGANGSELAATAVDAVDCACTVSGSHNRNAGPPFLLIHGIGAARDAWRFVAPALARDFMVISYDLRGHGDSPPGRLPFGLAELVADLERLRARLNIPRLHLAGHSLGGMIGPAYVRIYPQRVASLALISTAAGRNEADRRNLAGVIGAMQEQGIAETLGTLKSRWFSDAFLAARPEIVQRRMDQVIATAPDVFMNVFRIYAETEMLPWLHEISAPCLVMTGEHDGGCNPRLNRMIAARLTDAELLILDGLKHAVLLEAGEKVARHLVDFARTRP